MPRISTLDSSRCALVALCLVLGGACRPSVPELAELTELRVLAERPVESLDPQTSGDVFTRSLLGNVYEPLAELEADRGLVPLLASGWTTPDDTTWDFEIRRGVHFHDGQVLSARDVAYTIGRGRAHPDSVIADDLSSIRSISVLDDHTLRISTDRPSPLLLHSLLEVPILPADIDPSGEGANGTGPYRVASWNRSDGLHLEAFEAYWRGRPHWSRVRIEIEPDAVERVSRLAAGQTDLIEAPPADSLAELEAASGTQVIQHPAARVAILGFLAEPAPDNPFADPLVRAAVSLAIDREELVQTVFAGWAIAATQLSPPGAFGYDPDLPPLRANLDAARDTLKRSRFPAGARAPLSFDPFNRDLADFVASQTARIGVHFELRPTPWEELDRGLQAQEVLAYLFSMTYPTVETGTVLEEGFHSRSDGEHGSLNFSGFSDAGLDALIEQIEVELRTDERLRLLKSAMRQVMSTHVWLPLAVRSQLFGARADLSWKPTLTGRIALDDIRDSRRNSGR